MRFTTIRSFVILTLLVFGFISSSIAGDWVSFNGRTGDYEVTILSSSNSNLVFRVEVKGMLVEDVRIDNQIFQDLKFNNFATTQDIGSPALPKISKLISTPGNTKVKANIVSMRTMILEGYNVIPFQEPTTDDQDAAEFTLNSAVYENNSWYPEVRTIIGQPGVMRGLRVAPVAVVPFSYNPVTDQLEVATEMVVEVEFYGVSDQAVTNTQVSEVSPRIANWYRSNILNYDNLNIRENGGTDEFQVKYLIIAPADAIPIIQPLADFRNAQGYGVEIREIEAGFNTADQFRNYIHELYESDGLEYVLLVGDWCQATSHLICPMAYWSNTWSDSWYTMVDPWPNTGNDYLADLSAGRFVYDNNAELQLQMDKTMGYLLNPSTADNWAEHTLLVAHQEQYPQKYTQCKNEIMNYSYAYETPIFQPAYGGAGATNTDVINYLNGTGSGILNYRGHGSQTAWWQWGASGDFNATHIAQLTNADKLFVHFDVCCDNMDFPNYYGNCFCESFMKHQYGCVAIHSAIIPSYTIPNHDYDKEFYKAVYDLGVNSIGYSSNYANITVYNVHGSIGQSNIRTYLWLGDSAIDPWTKTPQELTVDHLPTMFIGSSSMTVDVEISGAPVEDAMVCAQNGDTYTVGYTNAAGSVTLAFDGALTTPGNLELTVTCHNGLPYQADIPVTVASGPYVVFNEAVIDDIQGNNNGHLNPGETSYLGAELENIGTQTAENVTMTISTTDPYTTINDNSEVFGNISAGSTLFINDAFEIAVSNIFSYVYYVEFSATITATGQTPWEDDFLVAVVPNIDVILDPVGTPITIPAGGGSFDFNVALENLDTTPTTFDIWTMVTLPNGSEYGPLINFSNLTLLSGGSVNRDRTQVVPAGAPGGSYTYDSYVGEYPNFVWDEDHFDFTKAGDGGDNGNMNGWYSYGEEFDELGESTDAFTPENYSLGSAYPNPFNPETTISFSLPEATEVTLSVFNLVGQRVSLLHQGMTEAGQHSVTWNAAGMSSGVYFYKLQAGNFVSIKKCVLMK